MSADRWDICPNCKREAEVEYQKEYDAWVESYGRVSLDEFLANKPSDDHLQRGHEVGETLRTDYEAFVDEDFNFYFSFSAHCTCCDFSFHEKIEKDLTPKE